MSDVATVAVFFCPRDSVTPPPRRFAHKVRIGVHEKDCVVADFFTCDSFAS